MNVKIPLLSQYGLLAVIGKSYRKPHNKNPHHTIPCVMVKCECGTEKEIAISKLKQGTKSCGCLRKKVTGDKARTHGLSHKSPIYYHWVIMKQRCYNKNIASFHLWGGRGIAVCEAWRYNYKEFYAWAIAHGWKKGLHLDRFPDKDGNYCPENCRWATQKEDNRNRRCIKLTQDLADEIRELWKLRDKTQKEIGAIYGVSRSMVADIVQNRAWVRD